jgi:transcription initiation factor TFIIB
MTTPPPRSKISAQKKQKMWDLLKADLGVKDCDETVITDQQTQHTKIEDGYCCMCNSMLEIAEEGFPTCTNPRCGYIYKEVLDSSPEWRFYSGSDDKHTDNSRCGNPINPLLQESSLGCKIVCGIGSSYEMKKIRRYTEWQSMPHREKSLYSEFQIITIMAQNAGIPRIFIDDAMRHHKEISGQQMFRGLNRDGIKAASIYIACRLNGFPRTAQEIATIFHLDKTSTSNGCSMAVNLLHNVERGVEAGQQTELCISRPSNFIERFCSKLEISIELTYLAKFIAEVIENKNIMADSNTPQSLAAGIIYYIVKLCNLDITKTKMRDVCNVSDVTINKCAKKIEKIQDIVVPRSFLDSAAAAAAAATAENKSHKNI